ncbi:single-stranded DNA-binding protein [Mycobacterium montefiorense]|uniref:Single-stranded DNA-binding protein n=2 Tax=Mycobacterium montefiorense TaxID=154654 RepID=A0AA37PNL2_9MYCO|nr:single-stranded DNA-binding protein [Mycobacterium montefiorense]GKU35729.1 single-stranded DNA-binding protein [Mycobacterium montefiorense]GKU38706.1 single-stranded DNA-binding protein [Mycobacterium montefiorense]GKU47684.1 single-stranded DNA-binding protein [Mycobacterium montefiorense]GKU51710.1 single-stranded DNA-binding protein [Mycobacterium montefiorense]
MSTKQDRYLRKVRKEIEPMFETSLTVVGHIVNDLQRRKVGNQELIKFRVASNSRRRTGDGSWEPGNSLFITVNCWGKLVTGVGAALGKGAPVIAVGHVYTSEYEDRDGNRRSSLEMRATSVGPDLSRTIVRIEKPGYAGPDAQPPAAVEGTGDEPAVDGDSAESSDGAEEPTPLSLSA